MSGTFIFVKVVQSLLVSYIQLLVTTYLEGSCVFVTRDFQIVYPKQGLLCHGISTSMMLCTCLQHPGSCASTNSLLGVGTRHLLQLESSSTRHSVY